MLRPTKYIPCYMLKVKSIDIQYWLMILLGVLSNSCLKSGNWKLFSSNQNKLRSLVFSKMITKHQKVFSKSNLTLTRSEIWTLWLSRGYWIALIKVPVTFLVFGHFLKVRRYRLVLKRSKWKWLFIKKQGQQQTCTHLGMYYLSCDKWLLHWVSDGHLSALNSISYS